MFTMNRLVTLVFLSVVVGVLADEDVIVKTKYGQIQGIKTAIGHKFLGVPFASPPVGNLR